MAHTDEEEDMCQLVRQCVSQLKPLPVHITGSKAKHIDKGRGGGGLCLCVCVVGAQPVGRAVVNQVQQAEELT